MDEKKIDKLNKINFGIKHLTDLCDYAMEHELDYSAKIDICLNVPSTVYGRSKCNIPVDVRDMLACLLLEKEELENEIKGEIKNEGK